MLVRAEGRDAVTGSDVGRLLTAAAAGDQDAWSALVDRYANLVWSVARGFGLNGADAADVSQATWLRLVERLDSIREPDRVGSWLATTARREALGLLRRSGRYVPTAETDEFDRLIGAVDGAGPLDQVLRDDRDARLREAVGTMSQRCQRLLRLLLADPVPSYADLAAALDIPVGSIGPTRARCLDALRGRVAWAVSEA